MKATLLIVFVAAAIVTYLLLSTSGGHADRNTQIIADPFDRH